MLENFKLLKSGQLDRVNDNMLYPLLRWASGSKQDLIWCQEVNKHFFYIPKQIQKTLLYVGLTDKNPYIRYPKSVKVKEDKATLLQHELAKRYYGWSEQELSRNLANLKYVDWLQVLMALGCESSDYKTLGIKEPKPSNTKKTNVTKKKVKTLLDF